MPVVKGPARFLAVHSDRFLVVGSQQRGPACFENALPLFGSPICKSNRDVDENPACIPVAIQQSPCGLVEKPVHSPIAVMSTANQPALQPSTPT